jgi:ATP-dependent helicase/nuclease subunit B
MARIRPKLYTIGAGTPFVDALAEGILARHGGAFGSDPARPESPPDPMAFGRVRIFLPTRRACRALAEAFLRASNGRPLLLPAISPLGDVEDEVAEFELSDAPDAFLDIPPPISPLRRQMLLTRLVLQKPEAKGDPALALGLAQALAELIDSVASLGLDWRALDRLVPERFAAHWQRTLAFLDILRSHWPRILEEEGALDPSTRRIRLIEALASQWQKTPPAEPVYAAGSTGSIPATAKLLRTIAYLPNGAVILPGLDMGLDEASFAHVKLEPGHPQFGLARLLEGLGAERFEVEPWPYGPAKQLETAPPARFELFSQALRPAATTDAWRSAKIPDAAFAGLGRIECAHPQEEALAIALIMRETLAEPGETAALITPDRELARRVAAELKRWRIEIDDSAGLTLAETPPARLLRLAADLVAEGFAPSALLALLKHPLAHGKIERSKFLEHARRLEIGFLRGPRPAPGDKGLRLALARKLQETRAETGLKETADWLEHLLARAEPLAKIMAQPNASLAELLDATVIFAEWLSWPKDGGTSELWTLEAGEELAAFVREARACASILGAVDPRRWPLLLEKLMTGRVVRPKYGRHPRLFIWGLLEARLQQADVVVLGGLNEGTWPAETQEDPWFSRPMRRDFGLPEPEWRLGLAAHDFVQAASSPKAILTRSTKAGGSETLAARWLLRLDAMLAGETDKDRWAATKLDHYRLWAAGLDRPNISKPADPPKPKPPVSLRPRALSVTRIETLIRDPYAIFAREILELEPLDPIDASADALERGRLVHALLDAFVREFPDELPDDAVSRLIGKAEREFRKLGDQPVVQALWRPRFCKVAEWFIAFERQRRQGGVKPLATEVEGKLRIEAPQPFMLTARADRIDRLKDGRLAILDYKTGLVPSDQQVKVGLSPQLPLEAAIAAGGGFGAVPKAEVAELGYCHLSGYSPGGNYRSIAPKENGAVVSPAELAEVALARLRKLIAAYDNPETPYLSAPRPMFLRMPGEYDHLARRAEWAVVGEEP